MPAVSSTRHSPAFLTSLVLAPALAVLGSPPARADQTSRAPSHYAAILEGPGRSVLPVRFQLRPKERPKGGEGPKLRKVTTGVVSGPPGQVIINASSFPAVDEGPEGLEPFDFRIVLPDGREVEAEVHGLSRDLNLAFLRAANPDEMSAIPSAPFDGRDPLAVGDEVAVVCLLAEPYSFERVVYATHLNGRLHKRRTMFSFDTTLPDLCGGGLVVSPEGRPIGFMGLDPLPDAWQNGEPGNLLSLFGSANQGQKPGYLMVYPASLFADLLGSPPPVESEGRDKRGWLGITMQPLSRDLAEYWSLDVPGGVVIGAVLAGSPAESAGLRPGDVVLAVDGESLPVRETKDLPLIQRRIRRAGAGKDVPLTVWREGLKTDLTVRLVASPTTVATAQEYESEPFGVTVRELTYDVIQGLNLDRDTQGVVVSKTERAGWAQVAGIDRGDIVQKVDGADIADLTTFREILEKARAEKRREVSFLLLRAYRTRFVRVKTDWK